MKFIQKIGLSLIFSLILISKVYCQDSVRTAKIIYEIPSSALKPADHSFETKALPREEKKDHVVDINANMKNAKMISAPPNGIPRKETPEIKKEKK